MVLHVFDEAFAYCGRVTSWINLNWVEEYRDEGRFTIEAHDTDDNARLLRRGYYYYRTDRPCAMLAVRVERDTAKNTITLNGYTALHLLDRRIVDLKHELTNTEAGIYELIGDVEEGLPMVTAEAKGLLEESEAEIQGTSLLKAVISVLEEGEYGIRAVFDHENARHVLEVYEGRDMTYSEEHGGAVFSQEFGNLRNLKATEDDDLYKNVVYVTGHANNSAETVYYQYVSPDVATEKAKWREMIVSGENQEEDESNSHWRKRQKQIAIDTLAERKSAMCFAVELSPGGFGEKYELGDKVTCKSARYGLQFDAQILSYEYQNRQGVEKEKITMGDKPLGYVKGEIVKNG